MKKLKEYWLIILILIFILFGCFYWLGMRPNLGKKECYRRAEIIRKSHINADNSVSNSGLSIAPGDYEKDFYNNYDLCLMQEGLK